MLVADVPDITVRLVGGGLAWGELLAQLVTAFIAGAIPAVVAWAVVVRGGRDQRAAQDRDFAERATERKAQKDADAARWQSQQAEDAERWEQQRAHDREQYLRAERRGAYAAVSVAVLTLIEEGSLAADTFDMNHDLTTNRYARARHDAITALSVARLVGSPEMRGRAQQLYALIKSTPMPIDKPVAWRTRRQGGAEAPDQLTVALGLFDGAAHLELTGLPNAWSGTTEATDPDYTR